MSASPVPRSLNTAAFDYHLQTDRIAQQPLPQRDGARLLHMAPEGALDDRRFIDLPHLLRPGDLLVANHTRVRHARLHGQRDGGGGAELLVVGEAADGTLECLVRPGRRLPPGSRVQLDRGVVATIGEATGTHDGARRVELTRAADTPLLGTTTEVVEAIGSMPLPPYIHHRLEDADRYQTLHAAGAPASAAAPTAGLHFTPAVHHSLEARGIRWATLSLDVGIGTFTPIRSDVIDGHRMHVEAYELSTHTADAVNDTRRAGGRVIAVGTTVARVLETCASAGGVVPDSGVTDIFIKPGHRFRGIDGLLTNFHQPRSSLLVLLAAVVGTELWRTAYDHALLAGYRFLSLGDCMLCWVAHPDDA